MPLKLPPNQSYTLRTESGGLIVWSTPRRKAVLALTILIFLVAATLDVLAILQLGGRTNIPLLVGALFFTILAYVAASGARSCAWELDPARSTATRICTSLMGNRSEKIVRAGDIESVRRDREVLLRKPFSKLELRLKSGKIIAIDPGVEVEDMELMYADFRLTLAPDRRDAECIGTTGGSVSL